MIRVLALLCLAVLSMGEPEAEAKAVADPKADPYLLYGGYYGLGHHYYGGYPYYGYYGLGHHYYGGYPYYGYYGKRSAEADPYLLYGGYYGLGHHYYGGYPYYGY